MPTTYEPCDAETNRLISHVLKTHHQDLFKLGVTVGAVFASAEKKDEPVHALKRNGMVIAAKIQITPLVDRARGQADAKLTICSLTWSRLTDAQKEALIDHELAHLLPNPSKKEGDFDDLERPRLKARPHDWELTGFTDVVERHGENSLESLAIARFRAGIGEQLEFWKAG